MNSPRTCNALRTSEAKARICFFAPSTTRLLKKPLCKRVWARGSTTVAANVSRSAKVNALGPAASARQNPLTTCCAMPPEATRVCIQSLTLVSGTRATSRMQLNCKDKGSYLMPNACSISVTRAWVTCPCWSCK